MRTRPVWLSEPRVAATLTAGLFVLFWALFLDGFGPRDSHHYAFHAFDLAGYGPEVTPDHWGLRWPLIASLALGMRVLGPSEAATAIVCGVWVAGLVVVTFHFARRALGPAAGTLAALFTAGSAFCAAQAFEVRIEAPETLFAASALWVAVRGLHEGLAGRLFVAGLLAGSAWLCRETAVVLPVTLGLASLVAFGLRPSRWRLILATSAGFLLVLLAELATYAVATGDPLYRVTISSNHQAINNGTPTAEVTGTTVQAIAAPLQGSPLERLLTTPNITPFLFGSVALAALALVSGRRTGGGGGTGWALGLFVTASAASWVISSYVLRLEEPAYAPLLPYTAGLLAAWATARLHARIGAPAYVLAAVWLVANAAAADLRDYDEFAEPRWLADRLREDAFGEPIATDFLTAKRVRDELTLALEPVEGIYSEEGVCEGRLVVVGNPSGVSGGGVPPGPDWVLLDEVAPRRPSPTRAGMRTLPPLRQIEPVASAIQPIAPLRLYRAGPSAGPCTSS